jgi:hypothetical protein
MGIDQKARSLYCGMPGGGFHYKADAGGSLYLPPEAMPYELEELFVKWAEAQPPECQSSLRHIRDGVVIGISTEGWEGFAKWMLDTLRDAQAHQGIAPGQKAV